jgi:hypothetical protein
LNGIALAGAHSVFAKRTLPAEIKELGTLGTVVTVGTVGTKVPMEIKELGTKLLPLVMVWTRIVVLIGVWRSSGSWNGCSQVWSVAELVVRRRCEVEHFLCEAWDDEEDRGGKKGTFVDDDCLKGNQREGIPTNHLAIFLFLFTLKKQIALFHLYTYRIV